MPLLYVSEPESTVRLLHEKLLKVTVRANESEDGHINTELASVALDKLEVVIIIGMNHITAPALRACLKNGVAIAWISRSGKFLGRAEPDGSRSGDIRMAQYEVITSPLGFENARSIVSAKLDNSAALLTALQTNEKGDILRAVNSVVKKLQTYKTKAESAPLTPAELTGVEGISAKEYFCVYGAAFKSEIGFTGRNRRPPKDPANALLSFCYTLLGNMLGGLIKARGLDPCLGFFHEIRAGRENLALDLLEELRSPVVDRFVLRSCNLRIFRPDMFEIDKTSGGVRLNKESRPIFFRAWERNLRKPIRVERSDQPLSPIEIMRRQVDLCAMSIRNGEPYKPFRYGGYR